MDIFKNKKILIVGDVMLDSYIFGNVERISPEAPVPIIEKQKKENKLGGAANVASNIKNLGGTPILCSVIGNDRNGEIFLTELEKIGISTKYIIKSNDRITTNKTRIIGNNYQMLRIDDEIKKELNSNDNDIFLEKIYNIIENEKIDCVLFQDYDKGVLTNYNIPVIILYSKHYNIPIAVDPKKNNFSYYNNVTIFKPNFNEFKDSIDLVISDKNELLKIGSNKLHNKGIDIVFITLGGEGIFLSYKKDNKIINKTFSGIKKNVIDVAGAGDTVISVIVMLFGEIDIEEIAKISNLAGSIACEEIGVAIIDKEKLLNEYDKRRTL